ncbi:MAG TPA: PadR family transcriptional regulator [Candidatus Saccharimonadales bacterium]
MHNIAESRSDYSDQLAIQMRKGVLVYCVLLVCGEKPVYSSDVIRRLRDAELIVVEGTLYPLLNRLARDKLLGYEWRESEQGPPRKYYWVTDEGHGVLNSLRSAYKELDGSITKLEKG